MINRSTTAVALRWLFYGAIVGAVVDVGTLLTTNAGWQNAGLVTTLVEFAVVGMLIGLFRHHLAKR